MGEGFGGLNIPSELQTRRKFLFVVYCCSTILIFSHDICDKLVGISKFKGRIMSNYASTSTTTFTVLYFATASSYTAVSSEELPAPLPLEKLFPTLELRYPGITTKVLKSCAVTVNLEYVDIESDSESKSVANTECKIINPGDEVGIIPPVSSG